MIDLISFHLKVFDVLFTSKLLKFMIVYFTGLLIFYDVAISHNWPQIATFRIICQNSHNSGKIAKFEERTRKYSLRNIIKFYDNLSVVSRWFTPQKTLEITKIAHERSIDQTGVVCVVLHVGDLVLVLNRSDCLLAKNRQSFVLIGHSWLLLYSLYCGDVMEWFIASHLNQVYQVCKAHGNVSTLFKLFLFW